MHFKTAHFKFFLPVQTISNRNVYGLPEYPVPLTGVGYDLCVATTHIKDCRIVGLCY